MADTWQRIRANGTPCPIWGPWAPKYKPRQLARFPICGPIGPLFPAYLPENFPEADTNHPEEHLATGYHGTQNLNGAHGSQSINLDNWHVSPFVNPWVHFSRPTLPVVV